MSFGRSDVPSVAEQKLNLRTQVLDAPHRYRVLYVGRMSQGPTGIIACLARSLESLGHTVFTVDTAKHRDVVQNLSGARGGYGPIYLQLQPLRQVLDTFRPDLLIVAAGGVVLDDQAQDELRDRGVISIGLTLSDPDVQASVIEHVARFDYHTTNAAGALARYKRQGVDNTLHFPFGIDRDFVLRDVAPAPELRADVICIGHATGRPERHEVMVRLAQEVSVRTYGSGWPLPASDPVSGDRLVQAAREGTFHVNFPATRAGFTNVKCGVFESIGSGGVLCTTEFDEMARLFDYGQEIVGYTDAEDLLAAILELRQDEERLELIRRRAFARLISEHLYEHRWNKLLEAVRSDAVGGVAGRSTGPSGGQHLAALSISRPRPRVVLISGYYGARNRGDDLLLEALAPRIEERVPDAHVVVAAANAVEVEKRHGRPAFRRHDPFEAEDWASRATTVIVGPGGLWHDYTIHQAKGVAGIVTGARMSPSHLVQLPLMVRAHGGTYHAFGLGVGPLSDPAARAAVNLSGLIAESVVVRDEASLRLLGDLGPWPAAPTQAPDIAYSFPLEVGRPPAKPKGSAPYIVVNARPWGRVHGAVDVVPAVLMEVAARRGMRVIGVPMQPVDETEMKKWASRYGSEAFDVVSVDLQLSELLPLLKGASAVVAMRLHASLLAHRLGRPSVGLNYDPKIAAHFSELRRSEYVVDLPPDPQQLESALEAALREKCLPEETLRTVGRLEQAASAAVEDLCRRIAAAPVRSRAVGVMRHSADLVKSDGKVGSADSTGRSRGEAVDLSAATVTAGNLHAESRDVRFNKRLQRPGYEFALADRAPRRGDYVAWRINVPAHKGSVRAEIAIQQRYAERREYAGRLAYEVYIGGHILFQQDITSWQPRNTVWAALESESDTVVVEVRVLALRDCEDWDWGAASALRIEGVRVLPWPGASGLAWGASSPYSTPLSREIAPTPVPVNPKESREGAAHADAASLRTPSTRRTKHPWSAGRFTRFLQRARARTIRRLAPRGQ